MKDCAVAKSQITAQNQIRAAEISLWENPCDEEQGLRITRNDETDTDLHTRDTKMMFQSRSIRQLP